MVRKFERRAPIDAAGKAALLALPFEFRTLPAHRYLVREGEAPPGATLVINGLAYRHKVTVDGRRQILSVHIPGDFIDLEGTLLRISDHNVQTLTECEVGIVSRQAIIDIIDTHPGVARAMWIDTLIDGAVFREWIVNVGTRDARAGMCHLICEFARRLEVAGLGNGTGEGYDLPMTQEHLADALGITPVHVNRTLKDLDREGLIIRTKRFIRIPHWEAMKKVAGFNELYLHFDQVVPVKRHAEDA